MNAMWNTIQRTDYEKLRTDMIDAHNTCLSENEMCLAFLQNTTYLETLFSVVRRSGPLSMAILSQVYIFFIVQRISDAHCRVV